MNEPELDEYLYIREKVWAQMEIEYKQSFELEIELNQKPAKIKVEYGTMGKISPVTKEGLLS